VTCNNVFIMCVAGPRRSSDYSFRLQILNCQLPLLVYPFPTNPGSKFVRIMSRSKKNVVYVVGSIFFEYIIWMQTKYRPAELSVHGFLAVWEYEFSYVHQVGGDEARKMYE